MYFINIVYKFLWYIAMSSVCLTTTVFFLDQILTYINEYSYGKQCFNSLCSSPILLCII